MLQIIKKTSSRQNNNYHLAVTGSVILIVIDQFIKYFVNHYCPNLASYNTGIVFGFINNNIWTIIFLALGIIILFFLVRDWKKLDKISRFGLVLISSGAMSNIIDRTAYGGAIDYIHIQFWSSFNLADAYIVLGIILYGWQLIKKPVK